MKLISVLAIVAIVSPTGADAACRAKVVAKTFAMEDPTTTLRPGQRFGPPTKMVVDVTNQSVYVCGHGSFCYEASGIELTGCKIVSGPPQKLKPGEDADLTFGIE